MNCVNSLEMEALCGSLGNLQTRISRFLCQLIPRMRKTGVMVPVHLLVESAGKMHGGGEGLHPLPLSIDHCMNLRTESIQCEGFGQHIHACFNQVASDDCIL